MEGIYIIYIKVLPTLLKPKHIEEVPAHWADPVKLTMTKYSHTVKYAYKYFTTQS